jgi:Family of unknown function (DUF6166)
MRTFEAYTGFWDDGEVWICESGKRIAKLDPHLEVVNKSPTGFAWGYLGSGPAQLSFALLAAVIGVEQAKDPFLYQRFKDKVIAQLNKDEGWVLTEARIQQVVEIIDEEKGEWK